MSQEENILLLIDEDGEEVAFEIIAKFSIEENEYVALLPIENEEDGVYLFKIDYDENEDYILVNIEDQDEFSDVAAAYEAINDEII